MTKKTFETVRDCTSKIKGLKPSENKIKEMFSFLSLVDRLAEICRWEGPSGIKLEVEKLPYGAEYEKLFRDSLYMWLNGSGIDEVSDYAADRYFAENPSGYDAAILFAAVYSAERILMGENGFEILDMALQFFLPNGWRWREENEKEREAHKDDKGWYLQQGYREKFLGDPKEKIKHRFADVKVCELISEKDVMVDEIGRRIAGRLPGYKDGALQLILKELTYPDIEKVLYALPEEAGERIISNLSSFAVSIIKGQCILNKDLVSLEDIREAVTKLEESINTYDGDPALEAEYDY